MPITKKPKTGGGSRKGVPNRAKVAFRQELQAYCDTIGLNPFYQMAQLAIDPSVEDPHLKFLALKELCQYLQPKLRAVVIGGDPDNPVDVAYSVKVSLAQAFAQAYPTTEVHRNGQTPLLRAVNGVPRMGG